MNRHLTIVHRMCPVLAKTAVGYSDKFEMIKDSLQSLARALVGINCRFVAIMDRCENRYRHLVESSFAELEKTLDLEIIECNGIGNRPTFIRQIDILIKAPDDEAVYFSEDDYIYDPMAFRRMMDAIDNDGVDFITPLDHPDTYLKLMPQPVDGSMFSTGATKWRRVSSTCLTFLTTRKVLKETESFFREYGKKASDSGVWLGMTKSGLFTFKHTIWATLRYMVGARKSFAEYVPLEAWKWFPWKIMTSRVYRLYSPTPSLCAHLCSQSLPPNAGELVPGKNSEEIRRKSYEYLHSPPQ